MLSKAKNLRLTETGPGTPMGELLRRYWQPIAAVGELEDNATKPIRLMGEDLVLYKDLGGNYGLVDRHCPHRRADMLHGYVEECGLRCNYHGWLYDATGRCLEQPYEETADPGGRFKDKIRIKAYPVAALAGLLWAYLGPEPAPLVPNWEPFTWHNGFRQIVFSTIPRNWFQCQENSIDPVHFEWMHANWSIRLKGKTGPYTPKHLKIAFDEFDYGFVYRRIRADTDEQDPLWSVGRVCLWPNALFTGGHFEWRVPIDDATTLSVAWFFNRVPKEREPYEQNRIPFWYSPIKDQTTGAWITSHVMNQDFIAWAGQGVVADRSLEHLGHSDRGVILMRQRFFAELDAIASGGEPKGLVRDPEINRAVPLPIIGRAQWLQGLSRAELGDKRFASSSLAPREHIHQAGQPDEIRRAYDEAMGFAPARE